MVGHGSWLHKLFGLKTLTSCMFGLVTKLTDGIRSVSSWIERSLAIETIVIELLVVTVEGLFTIVSAIVAGV